MAIKKNELYSSLWASCDKLRGGMDASQYKDYMTELEKIERAKMYMDKLANGINPIDDTMAPDDDLINNVRLSRCFFFVSDVLRQVIENGGTKSAVNKKLKKLPLEIPMEKRSQFAYSEVPIPASEIAKRINALVDNDTMQKLTYSGILTWLTEIGMMECALTPDGKRKLIIFMMKFIEQYKTTGYDDGGFAVLRERTDNPRTLLFLDIAEQVYHHYQSVLKQRNQIDFADMINDAHFYLQEIERQNVALPYKYIIIDEFQDIARQRFNLTKRLSQITQAKVVAVGDDWQSIYAFSGSDITLFTRFLELMGAGTELKITHTYRNSQELIDIAGGFVQRNTSQIRKQLISPKHLENPIVLEVFDDSIKPMERLADTIEHVIGEIISEYGEQSSILLIGRYNYDMYKLYRTNRFSELSGGAIRSEKYPNAKITFMTAHSSKGLGYDNVILINMFEGKFGFPCQIEDDPIIKLVTYEDNSMPFAEERRLFYVAMTRTKNRVYIAAPKTKPSRFLVELIKDFNIPHDDELNMQVVDLFNLRCPVCGFPLKYEFNKNYGLNLWICTNEAELCDFMTNDRTHMHDILKCPKCTDGYLIVKKNPKNGDIFYGCTNYLNEEKKCTYMVPLESGHMKDD